MLEQCRARSHFGARIELGVDARRHPVLVNATPQYPRVRNATRARFSSQCAFTMRGISIDAKHHHILVLESSSDVMLTCTRNLSARRPTRAVATLARFAIRCEFTMRGISLDAKCTHLLVLELGSDLVLNGSHILSALCHLTRAVAARAQFAPRCAFAMRRVRHEENQHSYSDPELRADLMRK